MCWWGISHGARPAWRPFERQRAVGALVRLLALAFGTLVAFALEEVIEWQFHSAGVFLQLTAFPDGDLDVALLASICHCCPCTQIENSLPVPVAKFGGRCQAFSLASHFGFAPALPCDLGEHGSDLVLALLTALRVSVADVRTMSASGHVERFRCEVACAAERLRLVVW